MHGRDIPMVPQSQCQVGKNFLTRYQGYVKTKEQSSRLSRLKMLRLCHYEHLSLKVNNVEFFLTIGFQHYCIYHCINVENLTSNTHCHVMISTHFKFLTLGCDDISFSQGYIHVEFDIMYFQ